MEMNLSLLKGEVAKNEKYQSAIGLLVYLVQVSLPDIAYVNSLGRGKYDIPIFKRHGLWVWNTVMESLES